MPKVRRLSLPSPASCHRLIKARGRGGDSLGRGLRRRPYPVAKREKIGAGLRQRCYFVLACGISDTWDFEYFRPPGQALLQLFEVRPATVAVRFAKHDVIG